MGIYCEWVSEILLGVMKIFYNWFIVMVTQLDKFSQKY
jgi:hypothetical protein